MPIEPEQRGGPKSLKKHSAVQDYATIETMLQLAIALPAGCLIGWLGGDLLDKHFHTGWMGVAGILVGAAAGFIQIFTTAAKYMKRGGD